MRLGPRTLLVISCLALVLASCAGLLLGATSISFQDAVSSADARMVLFDLRLPRVLLQLLLYYRTYMICVKNYNFNDAPPLLRQ